MRVLLIGSATLCLAGCEPDKAEQAKVSVSEEQRLKALVQLVATQFYNPMELDAYEITPGFSYKFKNKNEPNSTTSEFTVIENAPCIFRIRFMKRDDDRVFDFNKLALSSPSVTAGASASYKRIKISGSQGAVQGQYGLASELIIDGIPEEKAPIVLERISQFQRTICNGSP